MVELTDDSSQLGRDLGKADFTTPSQALNNLIVSALSLWTAALQLISWRPLSNGGKDIWGSKDAWSVYVAGVASCYKLEWINFIIVFIILF